MYMYMCTCSVRDSCHVSTCTHIHKPCTCIHVCTCMNVSSQIHLSWIIRETQIIVFFPNVCENNGKCWKT